MDESNLFGKESILLGRIDYYISDGATRSHYAGILYPHIIAFNKIAYMALTEKPLPKLNHHCSTVETILRFAAEGTGQIRSYPKTITSGLVDDFGVVIAGCAGQILLIGTLFRKATEYYGDPRATDTHFYSIYLCRHIEALLVSSKNKHASTVLLDPPATKQQFFAKGFSDWRWSKPYNP